MLQPPTRAAPLVLVVDDDRATCESIEDLLVDEGYEVEVARDGLAALELVSRRRPAALLVDLWMPAMGGRALCSHVRAQGGPPVLVMSGSAEAAEVLGAGLAARLLPKPFQVDALLGALADVLADSAMEP